MPSWPDAPPETPDADGGPPDVDVATIDVHSEFPEVGDVGIGPPAQLATAVLWMRGDRGVDCDTTITPARVVKWEDLSNSGNHAVATANKKGPRCGSATIKGRSVVTFSALDPPDEGHLEIDLGALVGKGYTIAMVEQRTMSKFNAYVVGSRLPFPDALSCGGVNLETALAFGYEQPRWLQISHWGPDCDLAGQVPLSLERPSVSIATFSPEAGFELFSNGKAIGKQRGAALTSIGRGLIGRGFEGLPSADSRYVGNLAELIILSEPLAEPARLELESYLRQSWATDD